MRALETLVLASIWAPLSRRSRTMITLPRLDAMCRGVIPFCRTDTDELRQKTKRTESKSCDWPSVTISFPLPLGWSWHWLLYWAAVELRSSFHSAQQCGGVWIQSAGTHKVNTMLLSFPLHLRNKQLKHTNCRHSCSILYTHTPCLAHQDWGRSAEALRLCVYHRYVLQCAAQGGGPFLWCHSWWAGLQHFHAPAEEPRREEWIHPATHRREPEERLTHGRKMRAM